MSEKAGNQKTVNKRIRNKWWKAVTLSRNKGLVYERMSKQAYDNVKLKKSGQATVNNSLIMALYIFDQF